MSAGYVTVRHGRVRWWPNPPAVALGFVTKACGTDNPAAHTKAAELEARAAEAVRVGKPADRLAGNEPRHPSLRAGTYSVEPDDDGAFVVRIGAEVVLRGSEAEARRMALKLADEGRPGVVA